MVVEVIDDDDFMPGCDVGIDDVGCDKAGTAGDENLHVPFLP